jgi:hypothetical protein
MGAPGPHGFAVRVRAARLSARFTSAAFRATFVTIAIRPLCRRGVRAVNHDFRKNEREIFLGKGLDNPNQFDAACKIRFFARRPTVGPLLLTMRCRRAASIIRASLQELRDVETVGHSGRTLRARR